MKLDLLDKLLIVALAWLLLGGKLPSFDLSPGGPRNVLIVHESSDQTPDFAAMVRDLRTGPHADYLKSKGHSLLILDDELNQPALTPYRPFATPELLIVAPPSKLLSRSPLPATASEVMAAIKAKGG